MTTMHRFVLARRSLAAALASVAVGCLTTAASADVVFVNAAQVLPTFAQNGSSWAFAFKNLQTALLNAQPGDEVWVAQGTYLPSTTASQTESFTPPDGVRILGGFTVGDLIESERDPELNLTILSGELGAGGAADNSQHVMRATNVAGTEIDGFVFTHGTADGSGVNGTGGALLVEGTTAQTDLVVRQCKFLLNSATASGGAGASRPATSRSSAAR